jgi:hypothetical protein
MEGFMRERDVTGMAGNGALRCGGVCALAVAIICSTLPAPTALADSTRELLLAQAYQTPPAYPPTEPPPAGAQPPPSAPPAAAPPSYPPPAYAAPAYPPPAYPQPLYGPQAANDAAQAMQDGKADANANLSGVLWFVAGFFLSWIGILLGYLLAPTPDGVRLIGKSPTYVSAYTASYQSEGKSFQGIHAVYGCVTSAVIEIVAGIVVVVVEVAVVGSALASSGGCLF